MSNEKKEFEMCRDFISDKFFLAGNAEVAVPQNTACVFQRDTTAAQFVISTEKAEAKVLGTELNVACYKGETLHMK